MNFALGYLAWRFVFRVGEALRHWYIDASRLFGHWVYAFFERLDRSFAVGITLRYFFVPLYKDYTVVGRILGVCFRSLRVVIGSLVYLCFALVLLWAYLVWLLTPVFVVWYMYS